MKFIKKTLLPSSKPSLNLSALCFNHQYNSDHKIKDLQQQLHSQYSALKAQFKNIKHLPKYQAYLQSFQSLLDNNKNILNKKIQTIMSTLKFQGKKKQKQIPLLQAFLDLSIVERYKFLIDILKNAQQHQISIEKQKSQTMLNSPLKKRQSQLQQSRLNISSQGSVSLNQLKALSLSYWTRVNFELNSKRRQLKVSGKQSFILYLQNYLIRLSKNEKNCFVLLCNNPDQVPSWLRKVYISVKREIFVQIFNSIWNQIINIQIQKMQLIFEDVDKQMDISPLKYNTKSPIKSISQINEQVQQMNKDQYLVFLTPLIIKNFMSDKDKFLNKVKSKLKLGIYKQIQFNIQNGSNRKQLQTQRIRRKLTKMELYKGSDDKQNEIHQIRGYFNLPASIVKHIFMDSLKQKNKYIQSWQILQNQPSKYLQAISNTFQFISLFDQLRQQNEQIYEQLINKQLFKFKQLTIKQQTNQYLKDQNSIILMLQSIKQISKISVVNFMLVQCQYIKQEKSLLTITCQFNKNLFKKKLHKIKSQYYKSKHQNKNKFQQFFNKTKISQITKSIMQNFIKQMIFMIFNQQKAYQTKQVQNQQQFYTICQAFNDDDQQFGIYSSKSIKLSQQVIDSNQFIQDKQSNHNLHLNQFHQKQINQRKISSLDQHTNQNTNHQLVTLNLKKTQSLKLRPSSPQIQVQQSVRKIQYNPNSYLKYKAVLFPIEKPRNPLLVKKNLLADQWSRLQQGGLTCTNQKKIKQQKQIIKKILVKLGQTILKQKNIMHVSLPVTIFKTQSQLTTVARGLTYGPLLLQPHYHLNKDNKVDPLQRIKKSIIFLISNNYSQINFQKPFNPILGQTIQYWIDSCPVYFQQISHHPPITFYYMLGRGYKIYGALQPSLSMGINHAKVTSHTIDNILFDDGTKLNAGANKMLVNGTTFGLRVFNLDQKNFIFDSTNNILALYSYGPTKKGLFSSSNEPTDFIKGRILKMSQIFKNQEYKKWKNTSQYSIKKQWIQRQIGTFEGIWSKKIYFDGIEYFDFDKNLPYQLIEEQHPLPSDSRYRDDLKWLIEGNLDKSQQYKQKMEEQQRYDKKLRSNNK